MIFVLILIAVALLAFVVGLELLMQSFWLSLLSFVTMAVALWFSGWEAHVWILKG